jgi:hypothetical protein
MQNVPIKSTLSMLREFGCLLAPDGNKKLWVIYFCWRAKIDGFSLAAVNFLGSGSFAAF